MEGNNRAFWERYILLTLYQTVHLVRMCHFTPWLTCLSLTLSRNWRKLVQQGPRARLSQPPLPPSFNIRQPPSPTYRGRKHSCVALCHGYRDRLVTLKRREHKTKCVRVWSSFLGLPTVQFLIARWGGLGIRIVMASMTVCLADVYDC